MDITGPEAQGKGKISSRTMDTTVPEAQRKGIDKRARSPSSEEAQRKGIDKRGKVCIVCSSSSELLIYFLDLASEFPDDGLVDVRPALRLDYKMHYSDVFCVLGSRLFVFETSRHMVIPNISSVYSFDLSSVDDSKVFDSRPKKTSQTQHAGMDYPKSFPAAVPTPDGKRIIVFSTLFNYSDHGDRDRFHDPDLTVGDEIDFELYDPADDYWEELPQIHHCSKTPFRALTFYFVNDTTFVLQTDIGGFALCFDPGHIHWKPVNSYCYGGVPPVGPCPGPFCVIEGELLVVPFGAYDVTREYPFSRVFPLPLLSRSFIESIPILGTSMRITLLDGRVDNGKCNYLCVVSAFRERRTRARHMCVDICGIDVNKYREDKEKVGEAAELEAFNVRALKLIVDDLSGRDSSFFDVFFMSGGT